MSFFDYYSEALGILNSGTGEAGLAAIARDKASPPAIANRTGADGGVAFNLPYNTGSDFGTVSDDEGNTRTLGAVPNQRSVRGQVPNTYNPDRRPGSRGQRYFTDQVYSPVEEAKVNAAMTQLTGQANSLASMNAANTQGRNYQTNLAGAQLPNVPRGATGLSMKTRPMMENPASRQSAVPTQANIFQAAEGGLARLAAGGAASAYNRRYNGYAMGGMPQAQGYYLGGATDGMADKIPATIGGTQEARLSDGEFVIPADVVSHLGNGNSNAGATTLHSMMNRVRTARTGNKQQGKEIDPNQFIPNRQMA